MRFVADLHIHSYLSRATSKDLNLESLHRWAQLKGISVVGTGDFTHPRWHAELREKLVPAGDGLFRLRDDLSREIDAEVPAACRAPVRFMLSVEISNIYKREGKVRKVHNLAYAPDFETAAKIAQSLARIGNIESDGRPILGLDSRDLLEIVLSSSPDAFLIPAHIWTPWFSALGAQSGFDAIADCYADLAPHIFAAETGLSSDPAMNWRLSQLDRLALVSNSDAHSAEKLGREANLFDCDVSYFALRDALRDQRDRFLGTVEFFPEEGKYHYDGHRKCGVHLSPRETRIAQSQCPRCGKMLTAGVMSRVEQLADRDEGDKPSGAKPFRSLVPLSEVIGEVVDTGPGSERVRRAYRRVLERLGPELTVLSEAPLEDIDREGPALLSEAVRRMRDGALKIRPGYDGEYGEVRLFDDEERRKLLSQLSLAMPGLEAAPKAEETLALVPAPNRMASPMTAARHSSDLNPEQDRVVEHGEGPLLVIAGPGTGKTRTIAHRIGRLVASRGASPREITAITFTRRAARELRDRLESIFGESADQVGAGTFHAFGLELLRSFPGAAGLGSAFRVIDGAERAKILGRIAEPTGRRKRGERRTTPSARVAGDLISRAKAHLLGPDDAEPSVAPVFAAYEKELRRLGCIDFDDLITRAVAAMGSDERARTWAQERCRYLFVDEYQDINAAQYRLVRLIAPPGASPSLCAVGDPDQAIYGFRGSDPSFFSHFADDYPTAAVVTLRRNYRSPASVVRAATAVIERSPGRPPRPLDPADKASPAIDRWIAASDEEEAEQVAAEIEQAVGGISLYSMDSGRVDSTVTRTLAFHDVAVLYRLHSQADAIEESLGRAGIPYQRRGDDDSDIPFETQKVALLSLHAAKGLEFPLVFVIGCEDGLLPLRLPWLPATDFEEERRLLYVGMTRARERLILTAARRRKVGNRKVEQPITPFLDGLPPDLFSERKSTSRPLRPRQFRLL